MLPEPSEVPYALCLGALCRKEFGCFIWKNVHLEKPVLYRLAGVDDHFFYIKLEL